jgi:crossover junction endodeoxyribonuclease RuvC
MLGNLLIMGSEPKLMDATDAVAVAVCHYFQREPDAAGKSYNGWKSFLDQNPDRMVKK